MGPIAISFGIACAVVLVITALCRSRDALLAAAVLLAMWGLTKIIAAHRDSDARVMMDAVCAMMGSLTGVYLMHRRPRLLSPWALASSNLFTGLLVVLWATARNMGFEEARYPYAVASNVLYLIALLSVLSLGLHDGAVHIRAWLRNNPRPGPWSRPGAQWGRTAPDARRR